VAIQTTSGRAPGLRGQLRLKKLLSMLQSMSQRFPRSRIKRDTRGGFGVLLEGQRSIYVSLNGSWSGEELRDFFALFAIWSAVDPEGLRGIGSPIGASPMVSEVYNLSRTRLA
jgi:hypothetical protein